MATAWERFKLGYSTSDEERSRRQIQARQFYDDLLGKTNIEPAQATDLVNKFLKTGEFQYPSDVSTTKQVSPSLGLGDGSGNVPVKTPISYGQKDVIGVYDAQDPRKMNFLDIPKGTNLRSTIATNKPVKKTNEPKTKDEIIELDEYKKISKKISEQEDVSDEELAFAKSYSEKLKNISVDQTPGETIESETPGFFGFGKKKVSTTVPGKPFIKYGKNGSQDDNLKTKATEWLQGNGQKVTDANIAAVIKAGKVK